MLLVYLRSPSPISKSGISVPEKMKKTNLMAIFKTLFPFKSLVKIEISWLVDQMAEIEFTSGAL
jgi:hypothetical protein